MIKTGYDNKQFELRNRVSGEPLVEGMIVMTSRGEAAILFDGSAPHKPASSGYVEITSNYHPYDNNQYYAGVIGAEWVML